MSWMDYLNPLSWMSPQQYLGFWQMLFSTLFLGLWSRLLAMSLLILAFWFGVRRRSFIMGFWCFAAATLLAYGGALLGFVGLLR